jgi:hypothetical protein
LGSKLTGSKVVREGFVFEGFQGFEGGVVFQGAEAEVRHDLGGGHVRGGLDRRALGGGGGAMASAAGASPLLRRRSAEASRG